MHPIGFITNDQRCVQHSLRGAGRIYDRIKHCCVSRALHELSSKSCQLTQRRGEKVRASLLCWAACAAQGSRSAGCQPWLTMPLLTRFPTACLRFASLQKPTSGYSIDSQYLYTFCASLSHSMRKFIMNVCLNPSNFQDNIYTHLPSAVAGSKEMMSSPQSRQFWLKKCKAKLVKSTHPLAAWSSDTQTH